MKKIHALLTSISLNKKVLFTILFVKVQILLFIIAIFYIFPFNTKYFYSNFRYPIHSVLTLQSAFTTWDAQHYLYLSQHTYSPDMDSNAFPIFFPFLIFLGNFVFKNNFISGLLISNISSFIAFYLFYKLVKNTSNEKIAYRSLLFLLIFPTSFYFSLLYTESVFFLLIMLFFTFLQKRKIVLAGLTTFFMPLTRLIGAAIIVPFFFSIILEYYKHSFRDEVSTIARSLLSVQTLLLAMPLLGVLLSMLIMYVTTGDFFTQFTVQQNFISQFSFFHIFNPLFFLKALFDLPLSFNGFTNSIIDRVFFLAFIACIPFLFKRVSPVFFMYSVVFALLPALSGSFMSYTRYLVIIFPLFIAFAKMSYEKKYENFIFPFMYLNLFIQVLFLIMHCLNYWVS